MSIDKVQLQQQEVINNEVVLTDINPITSVGSVFDPSTGSSMQEVIDRLWNAINSELSRIVNSVNNRTGAVVLTPGDVGLGNVDNVSFNDIKNWVVEYFTSKMSKYRFKLYDTFQGVIDEAALNDRSLDSVPFYAKSGTGDDKLAYIGCFYWDNTTSSIKYNSKEIDVVGAIDNSLNYESGHLSVKIHPDEDALYVDNGEEDPTKTGLRINADKFVSEMLSSPCMFGDYSATDTLLALNQASRTTEGTLVHIYIDGIEIPPQVKNDSTIPFYLHKNWSNKLKLFTQVITEFKGLYTGEYDGDMSPIPSGDYAVFALMNRQPAIGVVTRVPDVEDETPYYEIKFNTIKTFTSGMGIGYLANHMNGQIGHQLVVDMYTNTASDGLSGLAAKASGLLPTDPSETQGTQSDLQNLAYRPAAPYGASRFTNNQYRGLVVATDDTICRYPIHRFNPSGEMHVVTETINGSTVSENEYNGSEYAENWSPVAYYGFKEDAKYTGDLAPDGLDNGYLTSTSYLSVNANKLVRDANFEILMDEEAPSDWGNRLVDNYYYATSIGPNDYLYEKIEGNRPTYQPGLFARKRTDIANFHLTNVSGLRTTHFSIDKSDPERISGNEYYELTDNELKSLGIYDRKDSLGNDIPLYPFNMFSGGISVNTGNFLEICPKETAYGIDYDDSGKVNVRIGKGLTDDYVLTKVDMSQYDAAHAPADFNEHPDLFLVKNYEGSYEPIPEEWKYYEIGDTPDKKPEDWETNYYNYFIKYVIVDPETTLSSARFVQIQKQHGIPDFPPKDHDNNPYEVWKLDGLWINTFVGVAMTFLYEGLYKKTRTNRISVDVDDESVVIANNKLKSKPFRVNLDTQHDPYDITGMSFKCGEMVSDIYNELLHDTTFATAEVYIATKDFVSRGFYNDLEDKSFKLLASSQDVDPSVETHSYADIYEEYASARPVKSFEKCQLFTNEDCTGFYMAKTTFTPSGDIDDDITAGKILVIKAPT